MSCSSSCDGSNLNDLLAGVGIFWAVRKLARGLTPTQVAATAPSRFLAITPDIADALVNRSQAAWHAGETFLGLPPDQTLPLAEIPTIHQLDPDFFGSDRIIFGGVQGGSQIDSGNPFWRNIIVTTNNEISRQDYLNLMQAALKERYPDKARAGLFDGLNNFEIEQLWLARRY